MLVTSMVLFQFCWLPSYIQMFVLTKVYGYEKDSKQKVEMINLFVSMIGYAYAALSPFLCFIFIEKYRQSFCLLMLDLRRKLTFFKCGAANENINDLLGHHQGQNGHELDRI